MLKWLGAAMIVGGCGGWGCWMAANYRAEERQLQQLESFLMEMENELTCRHTQLPQLLRLASDTLGRELSKLMLELAGELERLVLPDVHCCMEAVLARHPMLPASIRQLATELGRTLGRFDLEGQLQQLRSLRSECSRLRSRHEEERDSRIRGYQTLGLCAGAALAILLL